MRHNKRSGSWIRPFLGLIAGGVALGLATKRKPLSTDVWFYEDVFPQLPGKDALWFPKLLSFVGSAKWITPVMAVTLVYSKRKGRLGDGLFLLMGSLGTSLENQALKRMFQRIRPADHMLVEELSLSYPSGHTMVNWSLALTVSTVLSLMYPQYRKPIWIISLTIAIAIGLSRLVLGVHWPSDVLGGWLLGSAAFLGHHHLWKTQLVKLNRGE